MKGYAVYDNHFVCVFFVSSFLPNVRTYLISSLVDTSLKNELSTFLHKHDTNPSFWLSKLQVERTGHGISQDASREMA